MLDFNYSVVGILAIITHLIINHGYYIRKDAREEVKEYRRYLSVIFLYYFSDVAWGILGSIGNHTLQYYDTVLYYIAMAFSVVFCCRYVISFLKLKNFAGRFLNAFGLIFAFVEVAVLIINHFYHIFFWFDENGNYQAGFLRHCALIVQVLMFGCISIMSLVVVLKKEDSMARRNMSICLFGLCMTLALVAQGLYPLLPLYAIGLMLGTLINHVFIHNEEISEQLKLNRELNERLKEEQKSLKGKNDELVTAFAIISGLSHDYHSIWWANKEDMKLHMVRAEYKTVNKGAVDVGLENIDCNIAIKKYIERYVAEEDRERLLQHVTKEEVLDQLSKSDFYAVNYMRLKENGGQDYNQIAFANADTADGKHLLVFGFRDINDILMQEQELRKEQMLRMQLNEEKVAAEAANAAKTKFLQNMSHEIRTPLNAMFGFAQLLGMPDGSCTEEEKAQYNSYIYNSYRMLEMLISDILDIADSEHGNYRIEISNVNVNETCQSALQSVEFRAPAGVRLYFTSECEDGYSIQSDGRRIQQVLINYLTNACKNTQKGEIHLHCSNTERPGQITFSVTDTGRGVPKEQADLIFNRFTKLNQFVQGSGLGLNICQTIATKLNGEVYLDTSYTTGARFVFALNVAP